MGRMVDMTGVTYSRLTGVRRVPTPNRAMCDQYLTGAWWEFDCACGAKGVVRFGVSVRRGLIKSCGCLVRDTNKLRVKPRANPRLLDQMGKLLARKIDRLRGGANRGDA